MKKFLKWGAIIVGSLIALFVMASFLGNMFSGSYSGKQAEQLGIPSAPYSPSRDMDSKSLGSESPSAISQESMGEAVMEDLGSVAENTAELPTTEKKVIKSGDLYLRVENADKAVENISQIARTNQGEVFASSVSRIADEQVRQGYVTIKVPFSNFEKTFNELKKVASLILSESVSSQDVTEQYTDLQSRLKNKQAEEASFLKILEQAGKMDDVLSVTRALSRTREEIEVLQGRIRLMDSQTEMSTIMINITEDADVQMAETWRPWQVIKDSVNGLMKSLQGFIDFVIVLIIQVIPILLLIGLLIWIIFKISKKIIGRLKSKNSAGEKPTGEN